ncbi:hypothetical protein [Paenarthrobacter sp. AMU7]|uniref:Uncharacterized protein n=1 Tax=Paenarthrobacter sp. AMU7 TaxID=3162492 RepID=A0AB39YP00_9MICC
MSVALSIYSTTRIGPDEVAALVRSVPKLDPTLSGVIEHGAGLVHVSKGPGRPPEFTVDGPFAVEKEDIPSEVTARVLGAKWLYQVHLEGSTDETFTDADKVSRKLTKASKGVLIDEQTGEAWPKTSQRRMPRPKSQGLVDEVKLRWFYILDEAPDDLAARYLKLSRQFFPEALPRRYGSYEPLQGNLERDGDAGFVDSLARDEKYQTHLSGRFPVKGGTFTGRLQFPGRVRDISLSVDRTAVEDPMWRADLQHLFKAIASELRCFYASAEVLRPGLTRRGITSFNMYEDFDFPLSFGRWLGLPSYPVWWSWYDQPYADLVQPHLSGAAVNPDGSLFHSWHEAPMDRDYLRSMLPDRGSPWIPVEFSMQGGDSSQHAAVIPPEYA